MSEQRKLWENFPSPIRAGDKWALREGNDDDGDGDGDDDDDNYDDDYVENDGADDIGDLFFVFSYIFSWRAFFNRSIIKIILMIIMIRMVPTLIRIMNCRVRWFFVLFQFK